MPRHGVMIVGVQIRFAAEDADAWLSLTAGKVRGKVNVDKFSSDGVTIGGGGCRSHIQDLVRARPV